MRRELVVTAEPQCWEPTGRDVWWCCAECVQAHVRRCGVHGPVTAGMGGVREAARGQATWPSAMGRVAAPGSPAIGQATQQWAHGDGREYDGGGVRRAWNNERVKAWRDRRNDICGGAGAARTRPDGTWSSAMPPRMAMATRKGNVD